MTKIVKPESYIQDKALGLMEINTPGPVANTGLLYTRDVAANAELFYLDSSDAEVKITNAGALNVPPVDATKLINSPYEVELSAADGGLTFRDTVVPTETLGILKLGIAPGNSVLLGNSVVAAGTNSVAIGPLANAGSDPTAAANNCIGYGAGGDLATGDRNNLIGYSAGGRLTTDSSDNVVIGNNALFAVAAIDKCIAIGTSALSVNTADGNVAVGYQAGNANTSSTGNTLIGFESGLLSDKAGKTAIGHQSGRGLGGEFGTFVGAYAGLVIGTVGTGQYDTAVGYEAAKALNTGGESVMLGYQSGYTQSSGSQTVNIGAYAGYTNNANGNVFLGYRAGYTVTTGTSSVYIGWKSGDGGVGAASCVVIGEEAARQNTAAGITAIGYKAGTANTSSTGGTYIGYNSAALATGANNTIIGHSAGDAIVAGAGNTIIGKDAATTMNGASNYNTIIGSGACDASGAVAVINVTALGYQAAKVNTAAGTTAIGYQAGWSHTSGTNSTYIGYQAGYSSTTQNNKTALGSGAGSANGGANGTFIGYNAGFGATGANNLCIGYCAGDAALAGVANIILGSDAGGVLTSGSYNILIGANSGLGITTTNSLIAIGHNAGTSATDGTGSTFVGHQAGQFVTTGKENTFIGSAAGQGITATKLTGTNNTAVGRDAGLLLQGAATYNTILGAAAGDAITSGASNILLGYDAGGAIATGSNNIIIGPIAGAAADARTFKVGYDNAKDLILSGVMYDGASGTGGTDSALATNVQLFTIRDPENNFEQFRASAGKLSTRGNAAADTVIGGLCLFGAASTGHTLSMKVDSLVTGGAAGVLATDTYGAFFPGSTTTGSCILAGVADGAAGDGSPGVQVYGYSATCDVKEPTTAKRSIVEINCSKTDGAGTVSTAADNEMIFAVRNNKLARFVVTGDGILYSDASATVSTFDVEDDIKLVQSFSNPEENIYYDRLKEIGVVTDSGFFCHNKAQMLSIGAIGQLFNIIRALAVKLGVSEDELYALAKQY